MKQLSKLKTITLQKSEKQIQDNGVKIDTYIDIDNYKVILQELTDEISASIYGADINRTYRVSSVRQLLEIYLKPKLNNTSDNISKYFLLIEDTRYKIVSVKKKWIDIQLV